MFRPLIVAAAVVVVVAVGLRAEAKKPPPKVHLTFTYGAAVSYPGGTQVFTVSKKKDLEVVGPEPSQLLLQCISRTKTPANVRQVTTFNLLIARVDLAHQTYPLTLTPGSGLPRAEFVVQAHPGGVAQTAGSWDTFQNPPIAVTYDSYDAKRRRLSGHFHGSLPDVLTNDPNNPLEILSGEFVVVVPKVDVK